MVGQHGVEGNADLLAIVVLGSRKFRRGGEGDRDFRLGMNGNVVDIDPVAGPAEGYEEVVSAGGVDEDGVKVERGVPVGGNGGELDGKIGEELVVALGELVATVDKFIEALELAVPEGGLEIRHAVVVAELDLLVVPGPVGLVGHPVGIPGDPVAAEEAHAVGEVGILGDGHAALPCRDHLDGMEAEHGDVRKPAGPDLLVAVGSPEGVGGVLEDAEAVLVGEGPDLGHIAGAAGKMDGLDDLGQAAFPLGSLELLAEAVDGEVVGAGVDVDEVDGGSAVAGAVRGGDEGVRGGPQPVAGPEPERPAGEVEGGGGTGNRHGVPGPAILRDCFLKAGHRRPLGQKIRPQHPHHRLNVSFGNGLATVGDHGGLLGDR